jgi:hypothetical protein
MADALPHVSEGREGETSSDAYHQSAHHGCVDAFRRRHSLDRHAYGRVDWSLTANVRDAKVTKILDPPAQLAGASPFTPSSIATLETSAPKYKIVTGAVWNIGDFTVNLREAIYGKARSLGSRNGSIYYETVVKPAVITDPRSLLQNHPGYPLHGRREQPVQPLSGQDERLAPGRLPTRQQLRWRFSIPHYLAVRRQRRILL